MDFGFIPWLVGFLLGLGVVAVTFLFNIQKYVIIVATALLGAGVIVGTFLWLFGGSSWMQFTQNPVRIALQSSFLWLFAYLLLAVLGVIAQYQTTKNWEIAMRGQLGMGGETPDSSTTQSPPAGQPLPS